MCIRDRIIPTGTAPERPLLQIALALDTSGSMAGDRLFFAKIAAENFVRWLTRRDQFALVTYDSDARVEIPLQYLTDKESVVERLQAIGLGGSTNLSSGYLEAVKQLLPAKLANAISRVILLTDGHANSGITDKAQLAKLAERYHGEGISLSCVGCGTGFDGELLKGMAAAGMGNFHFIERAEEAPEIFFQEFGEVAGLVGQNATCRLQFSQDHWVEEAFAELNPLGENAYSLRIGNMAVERPIPIPMVLRLSPDPQPVQMVLEYFDLAKMDFVREEFQLDIAAALREKDDTVEVEICIGRAQRLLAQARLALEGKNIEKALTHTQAAINLLEEHRPLSPGRIDPELAHLRRFHSYLEQNNKQAAKLMGSRRAMTNVSFKSGIPVVVKSLAPGTAIDLMSIRELQKELQEILESQGQHCLIWDISNASYLDSAGIGFFIQFQRRWYARLCPLLIVAKDGPLRETLRIARVDNFIPIFPSVEEARNWIARQSGS
ncbi:MAG: VWA domain-containing protein, partial [Turneriella sp.]|nr:VWA domain-containing protein [Turneriella sp.]